MMTANMNPKNLLVLAAIGIGAYWLTTRKALAHGSTPSAANRSFFVSPATASLRQNPQLQTSSANGSFLTAALNALLSPTITRAPGAPIPYFPDTAGEAQAQAYYQANQDAFAANPPALYQQNDGSTGGTGGYLDSQ